jgi:hypothetical protein
MSARWFPNAMRVPPPLLDRPAENVTPRHALLINPFYPKDPHAFFGKHVFTPTLTSVASSTPTYRAPTESSNSSVASTCGNQCQATQRNQSDCRGLGHGAYGDDLAL